MNDHVEVCVLKGGFIPYKKYSTDAGWDLRLPTNIIIPAGGSVFVDLRVAVKIPEGYAGFLVNRSSLAVKHGIISNFGIIDSDYIGPLKVYLRNLSDQDATFEQGDRLVQLLIVPVNITEPTLVTSLEPTVRGKGGFGSTGK